MVVKKNTGTTSRIGDSAVVVGASMAGLCATRELPERFGHVIMLDHDTLPKADE
jgi:enterochelin esterase-like enzyme